MTLLALLAAMVPAGVAIHPQSPGVAVRNEPLQGLPLCVWNDSSLFTTLKSAMQERGDKVFRFPNGSYSDIYHWNGAGSFTTDSVWVAKDSVYKQGWTGESIHRGQTNGTSASAITDGKLDSYWWSNPDHPGASGWFSLDLSSAKSVDSIVLWLGGVRPDSIQILRWAGENAIWPPPHAQMDGAAWTEVARLPASDVVGFKLGAAASVRYLGVRPIGVLANGWQVREMKVFKAGRASTTNVANGSTQTKVYAASAHPACRSTKFVPNWDFDTYMKWIRNYPGAIPLICVNYGTGTPEEAAAWIHYANKVKGYGIKRWQVGNESSGEWEEGGTVTARQYAERFVKFARAMRAEDPTIEIEGPVLAGTDFTTQASGDFDGRSWMQGFLAYVDSVEKVAGIRLVDGIDFHNYPYWFTSAPSAAAMFNACDKSGAQYDSLSALMGRTIADPLSRQILMTEFNTSTVSSSLEMEAAGGTAAGLQFAHFIQRFGDRGLTNTWELYTGIQKGPDGTFGSLSVMTSPTRGTWSSLNYPPNASFWTTRTIVRQWLDETGGDTIVPVDQVAGARLFAVRNKGRVSVLAFNMTEDSVALTLDATMFPNGGDILSWGTGEYLWTGTDADARAIPDNGPSSKQFAAGWTGASKIPPFGMLVVRGAGRARQPIRTAHWLLNGTALTVEDTLVVSGWSSGEGSALKSGTWAAGAASGVLVATDGAWDGPCESWIAKIPASEIGTGVANLKVSIAGAGGDVASDSQSIKVTGARRPVFLIADFENKKASTAYGAQFNTWSVDNGKVSAKIVAGAVGGWCLKDSIDLTQPEDLGYATVFNTSVKMPENIHQLDSAHKLIGIAFDLRTSHSSASGAFGFSYNLSSVKDYDNFAVVLPNTNGAWIRDTVLFVEAKQGGWGAAVPFELDSLATIEFDGRGEGTVEISLDNIVFLGTEGDPINVGVRKAASRGPLALSGRKLSITRAGRWSLRLVAPNGRVNRSWTGVGAASISLGRANGAQWAILESEGVRQILALPVVQ